MFDLLIVPPYMYTNMPSSSKVKLSNFGATIIFLYQISMAHKQMSFLRRLDLFR